MARLSNILKRAGRFRFSGASAGHQAPPTVAIYFREPMADLIAPAGSPGGPPVVQLTPTLFAAGNRATLIRYGTARELSFLQRRRFEKVYYLIDDDLFAAGPGDGLPVDYRRRLIAFRSDLQARFLPLITDVVAPSRLIADGYPDHVRHLLSPVRCHTPGGLAHHVDSAGFHIVLAGTRSHLRDIAHIAPALSRFLKETPDARLTTFLGHHAPKQLLNLPNVTHHESMTWLRYRRFLETHRFHVALNPALGTRFNCARSFSKIYDHAGFGAAGLYSAGEPFRNVVRSGTDGLLLPEDPSAWLECLRSLSRDRGLTRRLAEGGQNLALLLGDRLPARAFWVNALQLAA